MIGGKRLANAAVLARTVPLKDLAWRVYTYIEAREELDPILEHAAAVCLALQKGESMKPSIGRIVHYSLTSQDVEAISRRRVSGVGHGPNWPAGAQAHVGNPVSVGELVPMIICIVWPNEHGPTFDGVNGQAFLDGNDSLWVTSVKEGTEPGTWRWPARVE